MIKFVEKTNLQLGEIKVKETFHFDFNIENDEDVPFTFQLIPCCGSCTKLKYATNKLFPNESMRIYGEFTPVHTGNALKCIKLKAISESVDLVSNEKITHTNVIGKLWFEATVKQ